MAIRQCLYEWIDRLEVVKSGGVCALCLRGVVGVEKNSTNGGLM